MRRVVIVGVSFVILTVAFLASWQSGESGCHGRCIGEPTPPPEGSTPSPQERCQIGGGAFLLGSADLDPQTQRPLCLIDIVLAQGADSGSEVDPGETASIYARAGTITFTLSDGTVRFVPGPNDTAPTLQQLPDGSYQANSGDTFTISAGGTVYLDYQSSQVVLAYQNSGDGEAALLISSAPPASSAQATPVQ